MSFDLLSRTSNWDDADFRNEENREEWKPNATIEACKLCIYNGSR